MTVIRVLVLMFMFMFVPMRVIVLMPGFMQMLVWIMKMNVPLPQQLPNEIVNSEKQERASCDAWEPRADSFIERRAE